VLDAVSLQLGNTRTVCRKYYIHPGIVGLYEDGKLIRFLGEETGDDEEVLMKIMKRLVSGG
jgi:DNA topoisomerase I